MTRQLQSERRQSRRARGLALILAILFSPGLAGIAAAASPSYVGDFTSPGLCSPRGIALTPAGDVIVGSACMPMNMARFTAAGAFLGTWSFPPAFLGSPNGIAIDGPGNMFVTDYEANRLYKFTGSGGLIGYWSTGIGPADVAVNGLGEVFVADLIGNRVEKFTNTGSFLGVIGSAGTGPGQYQAPVGLAVDAGGRLYVADASRMRVLRFHPNGSFDIEFATSAALSDVAVGPDDRVYVITAEANRVYQYSASGALLQSFQSLNGLSGAWRIAISPAGAIYIAEQYNNRVTRFQIDMATDVTRTTFGRLKAMYR